MSRAPSGRKAVLYPILALPVLVLLGTLAVLPQAAGSAEARSMWERLADEGDRFFSRGQYLTASKLYQASLRSRGMRGLPGPVTFRWGISLFNTMQDAAAVERFRELVTRGGETGLDEPMVRFYLGYSLLKANNREEALAVLSGSAGAWEREGLESRVVEALAGRLAESGQEYAVAALLDRTYREARTGQDKRRVLGLLPRLLPAPAENFFVPMLKEGFTADGGVLAAWLEERAAGGGGRDAWLVAEKVAAETGDGSLRAVLERLERARPEEAPGERVRVGALLPLSGDYAFFGEKIYRAIRLALDARDDLPVTLVMKDTAGDPELGLKGARELIEEDGVAVIIGPIRSSVTERVAELAHERRVPVLTPAAQASGLPELSPYLFRNCLTLEQQAREMARAAVRRLGLSRFAVLSPDDNYGQTLSHEFWDEVLVLGGEILHSATYGVDQTDFSPQIQLIVGEEEIEEVPETVLFEETLQEEEKDHLPPYEAIFIPDTYNRVGLIAPQLSFHDIDRDEVLVLGSSGLDTEDFVRIGEDYVEGTLFLDGFFAGRPAPVVREFVERYRRVYGEVPDLLAAQAYDAAGIVLSLVEAGRRSPEQMREGLAELDGYPGVCGVTSMGPDGEGRRAPVFVTVFRGRLVEVVLPDEAWEDGHQEAAGAPDGGAFPLTLPEVSGN